MTANGMSREEAKEFLTSAYPNLRWEIEEYLSFANFEEMDRPSLLVDFVEYMEK